MQADQVIYNVSNINLSEIGLSYNCDSGAAGQQDDGGQTVNVVSCTGRTNTQSVEFLETKTWQAMGVPAGSTVTQVDGNFKYRTSQETHSATQSMGPFQIQNSSDTASCMASDLETSFDPGDVNASYTTRDSSGTVNVSAGCQASDTTVTVRLDMAAVSGNNASAASTVLSDDLQLVITYAPPPELVLSGTLYAMNEATAVTTGKTIKLAIGTSTPGVYTTTSDGSGNWSINAGTIAPFLGERFLAWVDGDATFRAATFTKASSTSNSIPKIDLYQNRVVVKHEGFTGTSTTNTDLAFYDADNDADIQFTSVAAGALNVFKSTELHIAPGTEFKPGGTITLHGNASTTNPDGDLHLATGLRQDGVSTSSILTTQTFGLTLAGNWFASSTAIFNPSSTRVTFNSTSTQQKNIIATSTPFAALSFSGTTGSWTFGSYAATTSNSGGNILMNGAITLPSTTFTVIGSGSTIAFQGNDPFDHNSGTIKFCNSSGDLSINPGGSWVPVFNNVVFCGAGTKAFSTANIQSASTTNLTVDADSGTVTFPPKYLSISGNYTNNGTIAHNSGTTTFNGTSGSQQISGTLNGSSALNNVEFLGGANKQFVGAPNASTTNFFVRSGSGQVSMPDPPAVISVSGNFSIDGGFTGNSGTILFDGSAAQSLSRTASTFNLSNVRFRNVGTKTFANNASSTNFTIDSGASVSSPAILSISGNYVNNGNFIDQSGTVLLDGSTQQTLSGQMTGASDDFNNLTILNTSGTGGGTQSIIFANNASTTGTMTMAASTSAQFLAGGSYTFTNINWSGGGTDSRVWLRSSSAGTAWNLINTGTQSVSSVDVQDSNACSGNTITANNSFEGTGNSCWNFTSIIDIVLSGTLYAMNETTPVTTGKTIKLAVGTSTPGVFTTTSNGSGIWSISISNFTEFLGQRFLAWVDGDTTFRAATFTKASSTSNSIPKIDLYQNRVVVKHEGFTGTSTTNTDLAFYDADNDSDIQFTSVAAGALNVFKSEELHIAPGTEFAPGGAVTLHGNASTTNPDGDLHLATGLRQDGTATSSILTVSSSALFTLAGNWFASSTSKFNAGGGTVTFNSTSSQQKNIVATSSSDFNRLTFSNTGTVSFGTNAATSTSVTTINSGAIVVAPSTNFTVASVCSAGSCFSQNGTFTHNSGTVIFAGGGNIVGTLIGSSALNNVIFRGALAKAFSNPASTTDFTVESTSGTVTLPSTLLSISGNYTNNGTINANGGTVYATSSSTFAPTYTGTSFDTSGQSGVPGGITFANGFFWVTDNINDEVYKYTADGTYANVSFDTNASGNADPYGITFYNGYFWVVDFADAEVYKYTADGTYTGTHFDTSGQAASPYGIVAYSDSLWVTDDTNDQVYKYSPDGTYTNTSFDTAASGNTQPVGITFYNGYFWVTNNTNDEVYKYSSDGTYTNTSFDTAGSGNTNTWSITSYNGFLWVTDLDNDEVYKYEAAGNRFAGNMVGTNAFATTTFIGGGGKAFGAAASTTNFFIERSSGTVSAPTTTLSIAGHYSNATTTGFDHSWGTVAISSSTPPTNTYTGSSFDTAASGNNVPAGIAFHNGFFWVTDDTDDEVYKYNLDGTYTGTHFDTAISGGGSPIGMTFHGGFFWVVDNGTTEVYKYNSDGSYTGFSFDTAGSGNGSPLSLTSYNNFFWVTDSVDDLVYKYNTDGAYTGISFPLTAANASQTGIAFYNDFFWVTDFVDGEVYKYDTNFVYTGISFDTAISGSTEPRGIVVANGFFWIVDTTDNEVYKYTAGQGLSGTMTGQSAFNNLTFIGATGKDFANNASTSNLTINSGAGVIMPALLSISGNYTNNGTSTNNSGTTTLSGASQQTLSGTMTGPSAFNNLSILNTSGTGGGTQSVIFSAAASTTGTFAMNASTSARFLASATSSFANIALNGGSSASRTWLRSSSDGSRYGFVVTGTASVAFTDVKDASSCGDPQGITIDATLNTNYDSGNNCGWTFPVTLVVSGTLYGMNETTPITGVSKTIKLAFGTTTPGVYTTTSSSGDGTWSITSTSATFPGERLLAWVDGSSTFRAATFTKASSTVNNIPKVDLYQNRVAIKHEGFTGTSTTKIDLEFYDSADDSDIQFTSDGNGFQVKKGQELHIAPGSEFNVDDWNLILHGNASTTNPDGDLHLASGLRQDDVSTSSILTLGGAGFKLAGNFFASSSSIFTNESYTWFNSTSTQQKSIIATSSPFRTELDFNGAGGSWTFGSYSATTSYLNLQNGTLTAPFGTLTVDEGDFTRTSGAFVHNSGTVVLADSLDQNISGTMTGSNAFNNIIFRSAGSKTISGNASTTNFTVESTSGMVTLPSTYLTIAGNYTNNGTINANKGTVYFSSTSVQNLSGTMTGTSAFATTSFSGVGSKKFLDNASTTNHFIVNQNADIWLPALLTIGGDYTQNGTITNSTGKTIYFSSTTNQTLSGTMNNGNTDFGHVQFLGSGTKTISNNASTTNFTIGSGVTVAAPTLLSIAGNYTNNGTFTQSSGTTTFDGTTAQTLSGTMTGTSAFKNLAITNSSATTTFAASASTTGNFFASTTNVRLEFAPDMMLSTDSNFVVHGTSGGLVNLFSTTPNSTWYISANGGTAVTYARVQDSNACAHPIDASTGGTNVDAGLNSCWFFAAAPLLFSDANQEFTFGDSSTPISLITVSDFTTPTITAANDLRIAIGTSTTHMLWDTSDTSAVIGGTASAKVTGTVTYEGGGSVLVVPVNTNFASGETLTISGLNFTSFTAASAPLPGLKLFNGGISDQTADATNNKTVTIKGTVTGAEHSSSQATNAFSVSNSNATDAILYAFKLTLAGGEQMSVSEITLALENVFGVFADDFTSTALFIDYDGDKTIDAGDTQVGGTGSLSISGESGTLVFSSAFTATTTRDYLLRASVSSIEPANSVAFVLTPAEVTASGLTSLLVTTPASTIALSKIQHARFPRGGVAVGGDAPAGQGVVGGGGQDGGESIGSDPDFIAPTTSGGTFNQWTTPDNAFASDGSYATAATSYFREDYGGFGFSIPDSNTIQGIEVKLELSGTTAAGTVSVALSWDGGTSTTTTVYTSDTLTTSDAVVTLGGPSNTWGRTWSPSEFSNSNFKVRVIAQPSGNTVRVDAIQVNVHDVAGGGGQGGGGMVVVPRAQYLANVYGAGQGVLKRLVEKLQYAFISF